MSDVDLRVEVERLREEQKTQSEALGALYSHVQLLERRLNERVDGAEARIQAQLGNIRSGQLKQTEALAALLERTASLAPTISSSMSAAEARAAGFTCKQVRDAGLLADIKDAKAAGYSCKEARAAGFQAPRGPLGQSLPLGFRAAGYSCTEAAEAGCSFNELRQEGWEDCTVVAARAPILKELKQNGLSCSEARQAGYTPREIGTAGYLCTEAEAAGFGTYDGADGGYACVGEGGGSWHRGRAGGPKCGWSRFASAEARGMPEGLSPETLAQLVKQDPELLDMFCNPKFQEMMARGIGPCMAANRPEEVEMVKKMQAAVLKIARAGADGVSPGAAAAAEDAPLLGQRVVLGGLSSRAELNGQRGVAGSFEGGRYLVALEGGESVRVRPSNLSPAVLS